MSSLSQAVTLYRADKTERARALEARIIYESSNFCACAYIPIGLQNTKHDKKKIRLAKITLLRIFKDINKIYNTKTDISYI